MEELIMADDGHDHEMTLDRRALLERAALAGGAIAAAGLLSDRALGALTADAGNVTFYSTQLAQVAEAEAFRNTLLDGFQGRCSAIFAASDAEFDNRVKAEARAGRGTVDLLGALHGSFSTLEDKNILLPLNDLVKEFSTGRTAIAKDFMALGKLGTGNQYYIPWIQATYVCIANKRVLPLLPRGANINRLTYGQYNQWAKAIKARYGPRTGFPGGPTGLIHRFFQGYSLPSFTGGVVTTFKQPLAVAHWQWMKAIWGHSHPQSLTYGFMQDPLLSEEVLLAWEHVARLRNALISRPDAFVVFPAPTGPKGLAYMPVLAGLAIPRSSPNPAGAKALLRHLLNVGTQAKTLSTVGFYPVVSGRLSTRLPAGLRAQSNAIKIMQKAPKGLPALLPIGLGAEGGNFNTIYRNTFTRTVTRGENIPSVLNDEAAKLQAIMDKTGAPCWRPDPPSTGACKVK
jgi:multiple sugar transport system substrate-binding protein